MLSFDKHSEVRRFLMEVNDKYALILERMAHNNATKEEKGWVEVMDRKLSMIISRAELNQNRKNNEVYAIKLTQLYKNLKTILDDPDLTDKQKLKMIGAKT